MRKRGEASLELSFIIYSLSINIWHYAAEGFLPYSSAISWLSTEDK